MKITVPEHSSSGISEDKNRLQEYTQKACLPLPVYQTFAEGEPHALRFSCRVWVDGTCFMSPHAFTNKKLAEQDAAKHALIGILEKVKNEGPMRLIEDTVFCKSILNEYAVKMNMEPPVYTTNDTRTFIPMFVSTVQLNGASYVGQPGKNKKESAQLAARSAILSILGSESSSTMSEIVRSKFTLYDKLKVKDVNDLPRAPRNKTVPNGIKPTEEVKDSNADGNELLSGNEINQGHVQGDSEIPLAGSSVLVGPALAVQNLLAASIVEGPSDNVIQNRPVLVFKKPKVQEDSTSEFGPLTEFKAAVSSVPMVPCIEFVPQASEQGPACSMPGKKKNRKKRKGKKNKERNQPVCLLLVLPSFVGWNARGRPMISSIVGWA